MGPCKHDSSDECPTPTYCHINNNQKYIIICYGDVFEFEWTPIQTGHYCYKMNLTETWLPMKMLFKTTKPSLATV